MWTHNFTSKPPGYTMRPNLFGYVRKWLSLFSLANAYARSWPISYRFKRQSHGSRSTNHSIERSSFPSWVRAASGDPQRPLSHASARFLICMTRPWKNKLFLRFWQPTGASVAEGQSSDTPWSSKMAKYNAFHYLINIPRCICLEGTMMKNLQGGLDVLLSCAETQTRDW